MEPNDPTTQQGRGTQQAGAPGSESNSRPGGKTDSAPGSASELGDEAKKAAQARAEEGADTAKRNFSSTASHGAEALSRAADSFRDQGEESLAQTTGSIASGLSDYAEHLEKRTAEDLIQDAVRLARQNPTLFVLGSVGIGLVLSRFFKASSRSPGGYN